MSAIERNKVLPGIEVQIEQKHHQRSGKLTRGMANRS